MLVVCVTVSALLCSWVVVDVPFPVWLYHLQRTWDPVYYYPLTQTLLTSQLLSRAAEDQRQDSRNISWS